MLHVVMDFPESFGDVTFPGKDTGESITIRHISHATYCVVGQGRRGILCLSSVAEPCSLCSLYQFVSLVTEAASYMEKAPSREVLVAQSLVAPV